MKLSGKVLLLWGVRTFALLILIIPLAEVFGVSGVWVWLAFIAATAVALTVYFLRYRSCRLIINTDGLELHIGILVQKNLYIKYSKVLATRRICTPLSRYLGLCNTILYCEGATFILPPLELSATSEIEQNIKAEDVKNES